MKIANRYEIIKEIGKGGMANVYLALDSILNREVAIKVLKGDLANDPNSLKRFQQEANASCKLSHPNAVDIYDVGNDGNNHYIVMEYIKGQTLKQLIQTRGALEAKEAVWILKQLSSALLEAHRNGIIHRDIKSQNVLIKADGTVKLADFGIAIINNAMQLTSKGSVLGSVHYLAPELAKGSNATMQSDIYSLGIVLYELLTGDVPYKADTPIQVALLHVQNNIPSVREFNSNIPQALENIVIKATARSLKDRYQNVALMIKDLNRCLSTEAANDEKIVLIDSNNTTYEKAVQSENLNKAKNKAKKKDNFFNIVFISILSLISLISILFILFITGIIDFGNNKYTTVPDISGMSLLEAEDILEKYNLLIDNTNISWTLTDNVSSNLIVSFSPGAGEKVQKGTKLKLTVSEGLYEVMEDYVGQNINEVKEKLKKLNINVEAVAVESNEEPYTILSQDGLLVGDKFNPNKLNNVSFTYSAAKTYLIAYNTLGRNVYDVYNELVNQNLPVSMEIVSIDQLNSDELNYGAYTVCRINPNEGQLFIQDGSNTIILYYYE